MLNYLLDKIAGPKCIELKVQNPEKFSFKPKELLSLTSDIFLKLSAHAAFAPAVIRDGRSYNPQVSRISLNPKPGVFNSRCDHKQELLTSLLFALRRSYNPQVLRKVVRLLSTHSLQDQAWLERLNGAPSSLAPLPRRRPPPPPFSRYKLDADPASTEYKLDADPASTEYKLDVDPARRAHCCTVSWTLQRWFFKTECILC